MPPVGGFGGGLDPLMGYYVKFGRSGSGRVSIPIKSRHSRLGVEGGARSAQREARGGGQPCGRVVSGLRGRRGFAPPPLLLRPARGPRCVCAPRSCRRVVLRCGRGEGGRVCQNPQMSNAGLGPSLGQAGAAMRSGRLWAASVELVFVSQVAVPVAGQGCRSRLSARLSVRLPVQVAGQVAGQVVGYGFAPDKDVATIGVAVQCYCTESGRGGKVSCSGAIKLHRVGSGVKVSCSGAIKLHRVVGLTCGVSLCGL